MEKKKAKIDVAVLILFFCRDEQLKQVFEAVKKARPSRLYLYQDGARDSKDEEKILACRNIVCDENIDWECEVYRWYREKNVGCDPSEYVSQKWMFKNEDMGIILEDDDVPAQSFFQYCKELLEKYKDDTKVSLICGMNNIGVSKEVKESYFFTKIGGIWGWASWKRFLDTWDAEYTWLDDEEKLNLIKSQLSEKVYERFVETARRHKETGKEYYETIYAAAQWLSDGYAIVPKYNLIKNIGIAEESTHSVNNIKLLPKGVQKLFYMKTYELEFPLSHPKEIKRNFRYEKKRIPSRTKELWRSFEHGLRVLRYNGFKSAMKLVKRKFKLGNTGDKK